MGVVHFYCAPYNDFGHPYRLNERKKPYHHRRKKLLERKNLTLAKVSGHLEKSNSRALNRHIIIRQINKEVKDEKCLGWAPISSETYSRVVSTSFLAVRRLVQGPSENEGDGGIWRLVKNTRTRVDDFEPLNMFKGIIFLVSVFLKLNSDDFPFF